MSIKDTTAKAYMCDNQRFADLFNFTVFTGKQVIKADSLVEKDSTEVISFFDRENPPKSIKLQKWRDILKLVTIKSDNQAIYIILGIENQSQIHYAMVIRNLFYDAISYAKQVEDVAKKHRKDKDVTTSDEFLSGFTKEDKLKPVITLTVYWGTETWDAPRSLYEMLNTNNTDILNYISDYKLNLFIPEEIQDFSGLQTDLRKLFEIFKCAKNENSMNILFQSGGYRSIKKETVDMVNTFLGMNLTSNKINENGEINMCKAWDDHFNSGFNNGITKGRIEAIQRMIKKDVSKDFILELGYTEEEYTLAESELAALV